MNKIKPVEKLDAQKPQLDNESYRFFANAIIFVGILLITIGVANWPDPTGNTVEASVSYWTRLGTIGDFVAGVGGSCFTLGGFIYLYMSSKNNVRQMTFNLPRFSMIRLKIAFSSW